MEKLTPGEKVKLTRDLTVEQYNTVLSNWDSQDGFDPRFVYYATPLVGARQVMLMRKALEKGREYLARAMTIHQYALRSPAMAGLLAKAINEYLDMQSVIALIMY